MPMLKSILGGIKIYAHTPATVADEAELVAQLEALKGADHAEQYDENYYGHGDIAATVRDETGRCIATVSIAAPTEVLRERREEFLPLLLETAGKISSDMGWKM